MRELDLAALVEQQVVGMRLQSFWLLRAPVSSLSDNNEVGWHCRPVRPLSVNSGHIV
jgi:hypothetical protein